MKHADLSVGMEVALDRGEHCMSRQGSEIRLLGRGTVVDAVRLRRIQRGNGPRDYKPDPKGQLLRIQYKPVSPEQPEGPPGPLLYVSARKIIGPWKETEAANSLEIEAATRIYLAEREELERVRATLKTWGFQSALDSTGQGGVRVSFSLEDTVELLRLAKDDTPNTRRETPRRIMNENRLEATLGVEATVSRRTGCSACSAGADILVSVGRTDIYGQGQTRSTALCRKCASNLRDQLQAQIDTTD